MDSLGAVYSRASSHIFGDWNACGKVMGLAPWQGHIWNTVSPTGESQQISSEMPKNHILKGSLYSELEIDKSSMMGLPFISRTDPDMFDDEGNMIRSKRYDFDDDHFEETESNDSKGGDEKDDDKQTKQLPLNVALDAIALASRVQTDLETVGIDFVRHFKNRTGQTNLCLAGESRIYERGSDQRGLCCCQIGFETEIFIAARSLASFCYVHVSNNTNSPHKCIITIYITQVVLL